MHWLNHVFFGLMFALGGFVCVLHARAKQVLAWIWALVALIGAAGLAALISGREAGQWRSLCMSAIFCLIAADHFVQYAQSKAAGQPKKMHLGVGVGWLLLGLLQLF
jgi:hypothetical protein